MSEDGEHKSSNKNSMTSIPSTLRGSSEPWLVYEHGHLNQFRTFYNKSEGNYYFRSIPLLHRKFMLACAHGWMVLINSEKEQGSFLFNPTTMEKIQLPDVPFGIGICVLTSHPSDPTCKVMTFHWSVADGIVFRYCNPHLDRWIEKEMRFDGMDELIGATCINGKVYVLVGFDLIYDILVVESALKDEDHDITVTRMGIEIPFPRMIRSIPYTRWVIESCEEIYILRGIFDRFEEPKDIIDFHIFKLDSDEKCWERVKNIGNNRAFFLDRVGMGYSVSVKESSKYECGVVYFTMFDDRRLYAYSIQDRSITVSFPCPNIQKNWDQPLWFLPFCSDDQKQK